MECLLGAHREPAYQRDALDAEPLGHQPVLTHDIVVVGDAGKPRPVVWRGCVAGGRRQPVAEVVGHDDEVSLRVQRHLFPDHGFIGQMVGAEEGGKNDGVVLAGVKLPVGFVA